MIDDKPLIYYAIQAGLESKLIDRVVLSTEDEEIAKIAKECGAEVPFMRPKEFAEDNVSQYEPTKHAVLELKKQGWFPDIVVLILANTPFFSGKDVDKVIETLINSNDKVTSVRSLYETPVPPHWMCTIEQDGLLKRYIENVDIGNPKFCIRQSLPKIYAIGGMADAIWTKTILDIGYLFGSKVKGVVFDREKSLDIDSPLDLEIARAIMKKHRAGK